MPEIIVGEIVLKGKQALEMLNSIDAAGKKATSNIGRYLQQADRNLGLTGKKTEDFSKKQRRATVTTTELVRALHSEQGSLGGLERQLGRFINSMERNNRLRDRQLQQAKEIQTARHRERLAMEERRLQMEKENTGILTNVRSLGKLLVAYHAVRAAWRGLQEFGGFFKNAIVQSIRLEEASQRLNIVLGAHGQKIRELSDSAARLFGATKADVIETAGEMGHFFRNFQIGQKEAGEMALKLVELSRDFASFNNLAGGARSAMEALRSALIGLPRPARRLGVFVSQLRVENKALEMGMKKVNGELSDAQKFMARYQIILEDSKLASGDFARTQHMLANSSRILKANIGDLFREIGDFLNPAVTWAVQEINKLFTTEHEENAFRFLRVIGEIREEMATISATAKETDRAVLSEIAQTLYFNEHEVNPLRAIIDELERLSTIDFSDTVETLGPLLGKQFGINIEKLSQDVERAKGLWYVGDETTGGMRQYLSPGGGFNLLHDIIGETARGIAVAFGLVDSPEEMSEALLEEYDSFAEALLGKTGKTLDFLEASLDKSGVALEEYWKTQREVAELWIGRKLTEEEWLGVREAVERAERERIDAAVKEGITNRILAGESRTAAENLEWLTRALWQADPAIRNVGLGIESVARHWISYAGGGFRTRGALPQDRQTIDRVFREEGGAADEQRRRIALNELQFDTVGGYAIPEEQKELAFRFMRDLGLGWREAISLAQSTYGTAERYKAWTGGTLDPFTIGAEQVAADQPTVAERALQGYRTSEARETAQGQLDFLRVYDPQSYAAANELIEEMGGLSEMNHDDLQDVLQLLDPLVEISKEQRDLAKDQYDAFKDAAHEAAQSYSDMRFALWEIEKSNAEAVDAIREGTAAQVASSFAQIPDPTAEDIDRMVKADPGYSKIYKETYDLAYARYLDESKKGTKGFMTLGDEATEVEKVKYAKARRTYATQQAEQRTEGLYDELYAKFEGQANDRRTENVLFEYLRGNVGIGALNADQLKWVRDNNAFSVTTNQLIDPKRPELGVVGTGGRAAASRPVPPRPSANAGMVYDPATGTYVAWADASQAARDANPGNPYAGGVGLTTQQSSIVEHYENVSAGTTPYQLQIKGLLEAIELAITEQVTAPSDIR